MVTRAKSAEDPAPPHFRLEEEDLRLAPAPADSLPMEAPYRRSITDVKANHDAPVNHRTLWFVGARSAFLSNHTTGGMVIINRTEADMAADGVDGTAINVVLGGHIRVMADGRDETFRAGDVFVDDANRPRTAVGGLNPGAAVYIPRERFAVAVPTPVDQLNLMRLSSAPLASVVRQQVAFLLENFNRIGPAEFESVLEATIEVSLTMLRKEAALARAAEDATLRAAKACMARRYCDPDLTPAIVAREIGCSRAVLYRAFAQAGLTVGGYLRELRLRHFLDGLKADPDAAILRLAWRSGFSADASEFTKLFKRAFGVTPSEAHARLMAPSANAA